MQWPNIFKREKREQQFGSMPYVGDVIGSFYSLLGRYTRSGQTVTTNSAMSIASVHRSIEVIANGIATMSLNLYQDTDKGLAKIKNNYLTNLLKTPNQYQTGFDFWVYTMTQLKSRGNSYSIIKRDASFNPTALHPVTASFVRPYFSNGELFYQIEDPAWSGVYASYDILHFRGLCTDDPINGKSPISLHAESLGIDLAAMSSSADVYKNGVLKFLLTSDRKIEDATGLRTSLDDVVNGGSRSTVLPQGVKMERMSLSPQEAMYIEQRKFSVEEISRIFGVPLSVLNAGNSGTDVELEMQQFYAQTLQPEAERIEQELSRKLLKETDKNTFEFKFVFNSLMRASAKSRADYYNAGIRGGWLTRNEARNMEDLQKFETGDQMLVTADLLTADKLDEYMTAKIDALEAQATKNNNITGNNNNTQS
ncbi:phage portal protein [Runella sp.]|uniref:phage portal protein n=1 Tax=Runella sp. TaxID=1960881 RepID=UPI003015E527